MDNRGDATFFFFSGLVTLEVSTSLNTYPICPISLAAVILATTDCGMQS